jgi:hypothetical protein
MVTVAVSGQLGMGYLFRTGLVYWELNLKGHRCPKTWHFGLLA